MVFSSNLSISTFNWEESEKVSLKLNTQKTTIMVSGPTTSWQINGETAETVADFILLVFILFFIF